MSLPELIKRGPVAFLLVYAQQSRLPIPGDWNAVATKFAEFILAMVGAYIGGLWHVRSNKKRAVRLLLFTLACVGTLALYIHILDKPPREEQIRLFTVGLGASFVVFFFSEGFCLGEIVVYLFTKVKNLGKG